MAVHLFPQSIILRFTPLVDWRLLIQRGKNNAKPFKMDNSPEKRLRARLSLAGSGDGPARFTKLGTAAHLVPHYLLSAL